MTNNYNMKTRVQLRTININKGNIDYMNYSITYIEILNLIWSLSIYRLTHLLTHSVVVLAAGLKVFLQHSLNCKTLTTTFKFSLYQQLLCSEVTEPTKSEVGKLFDTRSTTFFIPEGRKYFFAIQCGTEYVNYLFKYIPYRFVFYFRMKAGI